MFRITVLALLTIISNFTVLGQATHKERYHQSFAAQHQMLNGDSAINFSKAVFLTENCFHNGQLNYSVFKKDINEIVVQLQDFIARYDMNAFKTAGNWAAFTFITDGIASNDYTPYSYDFEDYFAEKDMTKMFVTKLMKTRSGNCHSLPYFYKILCDELGAQAHLAIAPNHVYIKHLSEKNQWTNVELTNATFPENKHIIKDLGVSEKAMQNKVYLEPLTAKESIAMTLFDLANNYEFQFGVDSFYLSILDTALQYFPKCIPLLMNKSNYFLAVAELEEKKAQPNLDFVLEMKKRQALIDEKITELGHEEMSAELEQELTKFMEKEKKKQDKKKQKNNHQKSKS